MTLILSQKQPHTTRLLLIAESLENLAFSKDHSLKVVTAIELADLGISVSKIVSIFYQVFLVVTLVWKNYLLNTSWIKSEHSYKMSVRLTNLQQRWIFFTIWPFRA